MIDRLVGEAKEEASHKAWCDEQYADTKAKTDELSHTIDKLSTKIDKAKSTSAALKEEVKDIQESLAKLAASQAEAARVRQEEKKDYEVTIVDLERGIEGVKM